VLTSVDCASQFAALLLRESTTLGVRVRESRRLKARRRVERISTPLGDAAVKLKLLGERIVDASVEYESARAIAAQAGLPLRSVIAQIEQAARARFGLAVASSAGQSSAATTEELPSSEA
jgi:uncharacterized protein (DUF111 family)